MNSVLALVFFVAFVASAHSASLSVFSENVQWVAWKAFHKKSYTDEYEESFRRAIWVYNLKVSVELFDTLNEAQPEAAKHYL